MLLELAHPDLARLHCKLCRRYRTKDWILLRDDDGSPIRRSRGELPPCGYPDPQALEDFKSVCPKGNPEAGIALNDRNRAAYNHYLECRATGQWPDDSVVRRNAALIRQVEEEVARYERKKDLLEILKAVRA